MMHISRIVMIGLALRMAILCDSFGPHILTKWVQSEALSSILNDPDYTLSYLREAVFVSHLSSEGILKTKMEFYNYSGNPILLSATNIVLNILPKNIQDFAFCLFGVLLESLIAIMLYNLAQIFFSKKTKYNKWEEDVEQHMNPKIFPISKRQQFLFGLRFFSQDAPLVPSNIPKVAAALYYLNPFTMLQSCSGIATLQSVWILMLLSAFYLCIKGRSITAGFILSLLSHLDLYYIIFLIPCLLLWRQSFPNSRKAPPIYLFLAPFIFWALGLNLVTSVLMGSGESLTKVYDLTRKFRIIRPSLGMQWYLFMNVFHRSEEYFFVMSAGFMFLFSIPLLIRYYKYPMEMATMLLMIKTLFKPTPPVQDAILSLCMATLSPRSLARMGTYSVVALLSLPVPMLLYLVDYYLFLEVGSAPANYMFFQCLAYNLFLGIIYIDMIAATTKRDKALRITESEMRKEKAFKLKK